MAANADAMVTVVAMPQSALEKGGTHHCECYVAPMVAKWEKEGLLLDPIKTSKKE